MPIFFNELLVAMHQEHLLVMQALDHCLETGDHLFVLPEGIALHLADGSGLGDQGHIID